MTVLSDHHRVAPSVCCDDTVGGFNRRTQHQRSSTAMCTAGEELHVLLTTCSASSSCRSPAEAFDLSVASLGRSGCLGLCAGRPDASGSVAGAEAWLDAPAGLSTFSFSFSFFVGAS